MLTAMLAVKNILFDAKYDLWQVNAEQEYHEEVTDQRRQDIKDLAIMATTQPLVPERASRVTRTGK